MRGDLVASYLVAFLFCLGLSLGALANLMLHEITGGRWGAALRHPWTAAARLVPFNVVLFVPLLFGLARIYPWIEPAGGHELSAKAWWLNEPFFLARAALYFAVWSLLAWRWLAIAKRAQVLRPPKLRRLSALGLIVYGLTVSLAAVDWIMSLMPQWYSTGFGLLIGTSQMLSAMALGVAACAYARNDGTAASTFLDFGNLLLAYVMTWAYLAFTQFLIIWAEDLPNEIAWYLPRVQTSWRWLTLSILLLQFALPFAVLLSRSIKRSKRPLGSLAVTLLFAQLLFAFYLVLPALKPAGFDISWSNALVPIAVVGLWFIAWRRNLVRSP
jgi:hypothetical protein